MEKLPIKKEFNRDFLVKRGLAGYQSANWDQQVFLDSCEAIDNELRLSKDPERLQLNFYADAFFRSEKEFAEYENRFSMPPAETVVFSDLEMAEDWWTKNKIVCNNNRAMETGVGSGFRENEIKQVNYGPIRITEVKPNQFVFIPDNEFESRDILGSNAFTACAAVYFRVDGGFVFSHITTGAIGVTEFLNAVKKQNIPIKGKINLVRPEWKAADSGEVQSDYENQWQKFDTNEDISVQKYPYIAVGSARPAGVDETTILVLNGKVKVLGVTCEYRKARRFVD